MKPRFEIKTGGKDITDAIASRLIRLSIRDESNLKSDSFCMELVDDPPIAWPSEGQIFEVAIGYETSLVSMGTYAAKHIGVSASPQRVLKIDASALEQSASLKSQREQSWENTTLGEIVSEVARRNGLKPAVIDELQSIPIAHEDQTESDIQFLNRLGRRHDLVVKLSERFLMVSPADRSKTASGAELPVIKVRNPIRWDYSGEQKKGYTGVRTYWYDNDLAVKRHVLAGREGVVLELEFNKVTEDRARNAAEAKLREVSRKGKSLSFTVPGNSELAAERKVIAEGLREGVDGQWVIKSVEHVFDGAGFLSQVECSPEGEKEAPGEPSEGSEAPADA